MGKYNILSKIRSMENKQMKDFDEQNVLENCIACNREDLACQCIHIPTWLFHAVTCAGVILAAYLIATVLLY